MEVELDVFSGRPNPKWTVPPEQVDSLVQALSSLPKAPAMATPDQLGYRGFIVRYGEREVRVYKGRIAVTDQGTTHTFLDSAQIEAELVADARRRGYAGELTVMP